MIEYDVCLIGNLIVDSTHCVSNFIPGQSNISLSHNVSVGSVANVLRALYEIEPEIKVSICSSVGDDINGRYALQWLSDFKKETKTLNMNIQCDTDSHTSSAVIVSDVVENIRSSIVNWGACSQMKNFEIPSSSWVHVMYGDKLDNLSIDALKAFKKSAIVSMDFCLNKHTVKKTHKINAMLSHIDYAILSVDEAQSITQETRSELAAKKIGTLVSKYAIIHSPRHIYVSDGSKTSALDTDFIKDKRMNVLGAGDMFAAAIIAKTLKSSDIVKNAQFAHRHTTQKLMESYEKEI